MSTSPLHSSTAGGVSLELAEACMRIKREASLFVGAPGSSLLPASAGLEPLPAGGGEVTAPVRTSQSAAA